MVGSSGAASSAAATGPHTIPLQKNSLEVLQENGRGEKAWMEKEFRAGWRQKRKSTDSYSYHRVSLAFMPTGKYGFDREASLLRILQRRHGEDQSGESAAALMSTPVPICSMGDQK